MANESFIPRIFKKFNSIITKPYTGSRFFNNIEPISTSIVVNINENDKPITTASITSNDHFKSQLELYPVCKKCLVDNGYDLNCIRVLGNRPLDCDGKDINYCSKCSEECQEFCNPDYGNTDGQFINTATILNIPLFSNFLGNALGATFQNVNFWRGNINPDPTTILNEVFKGATGAEISKQELLDLDSGLDPTIKINYTASIGDAVDSNPISNQTINYRAGGPGNGSGGGGGGGGGGNTPPPRDPCNVCQINGGAPASFPLFLVYRYSKCNLVWYPPEYIFNYQPNISQGQGWLRKQSTGTLETRTCDIVISDSRSQVDGGGGGQNIDNSCTASYYNDLCSPGINCICRDRYNFPCQCFSYPHLSGGLIDTVKKRFNVSQKIQQGGYFPSQDPFGYKMLAGTNSGNQTPSELDCMSCYNSVGNSPGACDPKFEPTRNRYGNWPKASGFGPTPKTIGEYCNKSSFYGDQPYYNPGYKLQCFNRGISPYLNRIARILYLPAHEIFNYGSSNPAEYETLGPTYTNTLIQTGKNIAGNSEWTAVKFKKTYNKKNLLYHKLVGLVGIDHHFECWAYHSKSLFCPPPRPVWNHARVLITPYERPYGGIVTPTSFTYDPRESLRFQILRSFPRSVIYGSSTVPIFYADIYAMEILSERKGITLSGSVFDGQDFLEKFYKYFYNMAVRYGETKFDEPLVFPEDKEIYEEVSGWLKLMIKHNILSVKDHAKDIVDEVKEVMDNATVITNDVGTITDVIFRDEIDDVMVGGKTGYEYLLNYLYDLSGACGSITWSNTRGYVNTSTIKKLINPSTRVTAPGQMFWAPRRVKLYPTPDKAGLTAWGCSGGGCNDYGFTPNAIPPDNLPIDFTNLFTGDRTWFAISSAGKVYPFGHQADVACSTDNQQIIDSVQSLGCFPAHISYLEEFRVLNDQQANLVDGFVYKVSSKGTHAVALVSYNDGVVIGENKGYNTNEGSGPPNNTTRKLFSNSGYINNDGTLRYQPFLGTTATVDSDGEGIPFTLRSWGENHANGIFYNSDVCISDYWIPSQLGQSTIPPGVGYDGLVQNKLFIWKDIAVGSKHTAAITIDGILYMTPESEGTLQTSYGYPTISGKKSSNPTDRIIVNGGSPNSPALKTYYNYPKPGYFTDEEWERLVARTSIPGITYFYDFKCEHLNVNTDPYRRPCDIRCYLYNIANSSLIDNYDDIRGYAVSGISGPQIRVDTPVWTNVAAGHYHTIALSSDNNLKIWGTYVKVKPDGSKLEVNTEDITGNTGIAEIPVFLPSGEYHPDEWILSGITAGCRDINPNNSNLPERDFYKVYTVAEKTVHASKRIFSIEGGPDYTLLARKDGGSDRFVIWGHAEMVESVSGSALSGLTGVYGKNYDKIEKIVAGQNAVAVIHKPKNSYSTSTEIFIRKGRKTQSNYDFGFTAGLEGKRYSDITLTYGNAAGIYTSGFKKQVWKWSSFTETLRPYQFVGNDISLPQYFRSQAFFKAVPGRWDITKWLFGRPCHAVGTQFVDNEVVKPDPCSIYYQKGDVNRSFSGVPHYYWMRGKWRRNQQATPLHSYEPNANGGCGLIRNFDLEDGLDPINEFGTDGDRNGPIGQTNRDLNTGFGTCFGDSDICWIGDGTPSAYPYYSKSIPASSATCVCADSYCGCPPIPKLRIQWSCDIPTIGVKCFNLITGRIGFNSNKDYFIQSAKSFGTLFSGRNHPNSSVGQCCGVVNTNITGFLYARREYYYAYNSIKDLYEIKNAPLVYRPVFVGLDRPVPGETYGTTGSKLFNEIMVPKDALIQAYTVDNVLDYPKVHVGGRNLKQLEDDYNSAKRRNRRCPNYCSDSTNPCPSDPCQGDPLSGCAVSNLKTLIGPGGWIHADQKICTNNNNEITPVVLDGYLNSTVEVAEEEMTLPIVATDDWLKGMVEFGVYSGRIPPGLTLTCWCGPTSPANPTGAGTCPQGRCANGEQSCENCKFCCQLNIGLHFEILGNTGIDDPGLYWPGNKSLKDQDERRPYIWYKVYEEIPSTYYVNCPGNCLGQTGAPIAFIGNDGQARPTDFQAVCFEGQIIGKTSDILCT